MGEYLFLYPWNISAANAHQPIIHYFYCRPINKNYRVAIFIYNPQTAAFHTLTVLTPPDNSTILLYAYKIGIYLTSVSDNFANPLLHGFRKPLSNCNPDYFVTLNIVFFHSHAQRFILVTVYALVRLLTSSRPCPYGITTKRPACNLSHTMKTYGSDTLARLHVDYFLSALDGFGLQQSIIGTPQNLATGYSFNLLIVTISFGIFHDLTQPEQISIIECSNGLCRCCECRKAV